MTSPSGLDKAGVGTQKRPGEEQTLSPPARAVGQFHRNADVNAGRDAIHHTLGNQDYQAAPGSHIHQGGNGQALLDGITITGSRSANVASILDQLANVVAQLGGINSTGP